MSNQVTWASHNVIFPGDPHKYEFKNKVRSQRRAAAGPGRGQGRAGPGQGRAQNARPLQQFSPTFAFLQRLVKWIGAAAAAAAAADAAAAATDQALAGGSGQRSKRKATAEGGGGKRPKHKDMGKQKGEGAAAAAAAVALAAVAASAPAAAPAAAAAAPAAAAPAAAAAGGQRRADTPAVLAADAPYRLQLRKRPLARATVDGDNLKVRRRRSGDRPGNQAARAGRSC